MQGYHEQNPSSIVHLAAMQEQPCPKQSAFCWPMQPATSTTWSGQKSKHFWLGNSMSGWAVLHL